MYFNYFIILECLELYVGFTVCYFFVCETLFYRKSFSDFKVWQLFLNNFVSEWLWSWGNFLIFFVNFLISGKSRFNYFFYFLFGVIRIKMRVHNWNDHGILTISFLDVANHWNKSGKMLSNHRHLTFLSVFGSREWYFLGRADMLGYFTWKTVRVSYLKNFFNFLFRYIMSPMTRKYHRGRISVSVNRNTI